MIFCFSGFLNKTNARGLKQSSDFFNKIKFDEIMGTILWIKNWIGGEKTNAPVLENQKIICLALLGIDDIAGRHGSFGKFCGLPRQGSWVWHPDRSQSVCSVFVFFLLVVASPFGPLSQNHDWRLSIIANVFALSTVDWLSF